MARWRTARCIGGDRCSHLDSIRVRNCFAFIGSSCTVVDRQQRARFNNALLSTLLHPWASGRPQVRSQASVSGFAERQRRFRCLIVDEASTLIRRDTQAAMTSSFLALCYCALFLLQRYGAADAVPIRAPHHSSPIIALIVDDHRAVSSTRKTHVAQPSPAMPALLRTSRVSACPPLLRSVLPRRPHQSLPPPPLAQPPSTKPFLLPPADPLPQRLFPSPPNP